MTSYLRSILVPAVPVERCFVVLEGAERAWLAGSDDEADAKLLAARFGALLAGDVPMAARAEVAMGQLAVTIDNEERALVHLQAAQGQLPETDLEWRTRLWLLAAVVQRRMGLVEQLEPPDPDGLAAAGLDGLAALVCAELAIWARERGDLAAAMEHAERALALAPGRSRPRALALLALAEAQFLDGDLAAARGSFEVATGLLNQLGLARDEGRALVRYALTVAAAAPPGTTDTPAVWLARARMVLGAAATWRDIVSLRSGFRIHGRRLQDRAVAGQVASQVDALERNAAGLHNAVSAAVVRADRALGHAQRELGEATEAVQLRMAEVRQAVLGVVERSARHSGRLSEIGQDLVDLLELAVVERNRMQALIAVIAEIDPVLELPALYRTGVEAARRLLNADQAVIARRGPTGDLEQLARAGSTDRAADPESWRSWVEDALRVPATEGTARPTSVTRATQRRCGPVLVCPLGRRRPTEALYLDRLARGGQFTEHDHALARLFANYFALASERLVQLSARRDAFDELSTTLDTLRDGVVALEDDGVVTYANVAALRMLRVMREQLVGLPLASITKLEPLARVLEGLRPLVEGVELGAPRPRDTSFDTAAVHLGYGSFIVTARAVQNESRQCLVATVAELDRVQRVTARCTSGRPRYTFEDILGKCPAMAGAVSLAKQAAIVDASVLITGESGTGKELFAQAIHTGGPRVFEPFVGVNCAAIPRDLLESELFGYERGAFTGARREGQLGKLELAAGGTVLLDEIGDMPQDMQAKLLRVLQERVVVRIGGSAENPFEARVIATTHLDLKHLSELGRFRQDLLYRLNVLHIHLPPLRERGDDIVLYARYFLERFARQQGKRTRELSEEAARQLTAHPWPGNVRELANVIEREVTLVDGDAETLQRVSGLASDAAPQPELEPLLPLAEVERRAFLHALECCGGNVNRAAKALDVSKATFYAKLRLWGLHPRGPRPE